MRLPVRYRPLLGVNGTLGLEVDADGCPLAWPTPGTYPPPGFLPITPFQLGNGDLFGFYWPLGRETEEPVVCELAHDAWALVPCAGSLEGLVAWLAGSGQIDEEHPERAALVRIADALGVALPREADALTPDRHLALDGGAPQALLLAARAAAARQDLAAALRHLEAAVERLPDFGEAWDALAALRRRLGDREGGARALVEALGAPACFGGDRLRLLQDARRLPDEAAASLRDDPLWRRRHALTFTTGQKHSDDYGLLDEAIAEYLTAGQGVRAARLRVLHGERMSRETTAFRERYAFSPARHLDRLRAELAYAGLHSRLPALAG